CSATARSASVTAISMSPTGSPSRGSCGSIAPTGSS
ncbi:MAG: hypothetical protein AVDCRST_MAG59-2865, partial [uncultured Thermomicrobiales bacterium]